MVRDGRKREANLARHGFDFASFATSFDRDAALYLPAKAGRTGRERYPVIGDGNGDTIVASVISPLGSEAVFLVGLGSASPAEKRGYEHTDRKTGFPAPRHSHEDWEEVSDDPELTAEELARLRPAREMPRHIFKALPRKRASRKRGASMGP